MSEVSAVFYGDDFTGSVDALLQFARHGWRGRLFVGVPSADRLAEAAASSDVVGIAGIARSLPTDALDAEVAPALRALVSLAPRIVQYKACSTADSAPETGSLGRVIEIGREVVRPVGTVPLLFAQPDFGRYTAFGHHFAAENGTVHRLDRQPTMSTHPSTPMTESDLALHLGRQTDLAVGSVHFPSYLDADRLGAGLSAAPHAAVVLDALDERHLRLIGDALTSLTAPVFAIGSGGLSWAIAAAAERPGDPPPASPADTAHDSARGSARDHEPVLAVSGSRSPATRRQADAAAAAGWLVRPLSLRHDDDSDDSDVRDALAAGRSVALTSDDADLEGTGDVLPRIAAAAASVIGRALAAGLTRRIIVCGGDTSSRVTGLLGATSLSIAANPWGNVVLLRAHADDPAVDGAQLLLKGGQVGDDDLFERIRTLGA